MRIAEAPSPNHGERRGGVPDMVVLHYTAMADAQAALDRLRDPAAEVSAHYLIARDGHAWRLAPEARRAWHAGAGRWGACADVNSHSIGIELDNPGDAPFPLPQMRALEALLTDVMARWRMPPARVIGHACMAPLRKQDPGPRFDWRALARRGLAVWGDPPPSCGAAADAGAFQRAAAAFGYPAPQSGDWDRETMALWRAYVDRFAPGRAGCEPDAALVAHLAWLAARWPVSS